MSTQDDYEPKSRRAREDKPRFVDDRDDDYPKSRAPRYGDESPPPDTRRPKPTGRDSNRPRDDSNDGLGRRTRDPRDIEPSERRSTKARGDDYGSDEDSRPRRSEAAKPRRRAYDDNDDEGSASRNRKDRDIPRSRQPAGWEEPMRMSESKRRDRDAYAEPPRRKTRDPYDDDVEPIRRRATDRPDGYNPRDRPRRDDRKYDSHDEDYRPPRRRDPYEERYADPYDRRRREGGYDSDRGPPRRSGTSYRDDRGDKDRYRSDRDRRDRDRSRDRSRDGGDKRKKKSGFKLDDINKYVEQGQKHYTTFKPIIDNLTKMYLNNHK